MDGSSGSQPRQELSSGTASRDKQQVGEQADIAVMLMVVLIVS